MFLEIAQNSQENNCARVSFLIKLQTEASATFYYRTRPVAASGKSKCFKVYFLTRAFYYFGSTCCMLFTVSSKLFCTLRVPLYEKWTPKILIVPIVKSMDFKPQTIFLESFFVKPATQQHALLQKIDSPEGTFREFCKITFLNRLRWVIQWKLYWRP